MSKKRLVVYGCSFSSGSANAAIGSTEHDSDSKTNYANLAGQKLGYDKIILNGIGGFSNQQITSRIIHDIQNEVIESTDDILIQQTSQWRKNIGDTRFDGVTMHTPDVIDYNHVRYSNDDFLRELVNHQTALHWYTNGAQYLPWGGIREISSNLETVSIVKKTIAEWDLLLTNLCFLTTALSALDIKFPGNKIFVMPFVPLTNGSYEKAVDDINGQQLLSLLYSGWASSIDTHRFHILTVNPFNYYQNNPNYWDENNKNHRKVDHSTEEFHSNFADLLYKQMKPFYD